MHYRPVQVNLGHLNDAPHWQDEALSIRMSGRDSFLGVTGTQLIEGIRGTRCRVNVTFHDFKDLKTLRRLLFENMALDDASLS